MRSEGRRPRVAPARKHRRARRHPGRARSLKKLKTIAVKANGTYSFKAKRGTFFEVVARREARERTAAVHGSHSRLATVLPALQEAGPTVRVPAASVYFCCLSVVAAFHEHRAA